MRDISISFLDLWVENAVLLLCSSERDFRLVLKKFPLKRASGASTAAGHAAHRDAKTQFRHSVATVDQIARLKKLPCQVRPA
jgi:hypothetical protein